MPLTSPVPPAPQSRLASPGQAPAPSFKPTPEQQAICDAYVDGNRLVVEALAGTGKTTTLKQIAGIYPQRPGLYLAFGKDVARAAEGSMPGRVEVSTAHALAYRAVGSQFGHRLPGNPGSTRMPAQAMARILRVKPLLLNDGTLNPVVVTRIAQATVTKFMKTADTHIAAHHIPDRALALHDAQDQGALVAAVLPVARAIWADLTKTDGKFYFTHDVYLKLWALSNPVLPYSYIMFDEAQDADPVIASVVSRQAAQLLYVGDENQAIYEWRGAVNALAQVQGATRLPLRKSFRFGPAIAEAANEWLSALDARWRLIGHDPIRSTVGEVDQPRAILCRTNGTALGWVLAFHERGVPVALAPGDRSAGKDMERFAWGARDLMAGNGSDHPDLVGFPDWAAAVKFAEEEEDTADLKRMIGIVNRIGPNGVIDAIRALVPEEKAIVTVSTAHKAKGLEWSDVKVADDFVPPEPGEDGKIEPDREGMRLAYVTVTRAKQRLDPGALANPEMWS